MTTLQLAHSLARHLKEKDLMQISAAAKLDILQAINSSLQTIYAAMPPAHKTTTISETLRAPVTVAFAVAERYTNVLLEPVFTEKQQGCTAFLADDASANEIVAPNAILDQYLGQALSGNATVYHDAVHIHDVIERVCAPPTLFRNGEQVRKLDRWQTDFDKLDKKTPGTPQRYCLIPCGSSQGANPEFYLRVWPMPDGDYKLRFDAEIATVRVTFPQITQSPVDLPVNDRIAESVLLPIARERLLISGEWADRSTASRVEKDAEKAMQQLKTMPWDIAPAFNAVGTPGNF